MLGRIFGKNGGKPVVAVNSDVEWTSWAVQKRQIELFEEHGLDVSFSYWFFANPLVTWHFFDENGELREEAEEAFEYAEKGYFDTLHSFGGRRHAGGCDYELAAIGKAYEEFRRRGISIPIFTNHGGDADNQNVGGDWATHHQGDVPGSPLYHLDLTLKEGVKYFWCDPDFTVDRVFLKASLNRPDSLFVEDRVRDGSVILRFRRFLGQLSEGCCLTNFTDQVDQILEPRKGRGRFCVVYQHLGVVRNPDGTPRSATMEEVERYLVPGLARLSEAQKNGSIEVRRTSDLLDMARSSLRRRSVAASANAAFPR